MSKEMYDSIPPTIELREIRYVVTKPGRRQQPFVIVTTMSDVDGDAAVTRDELADLFGFRWNVENVTSCVNLSNIPKKEWHDPIPNLSPHRATRRAMIHRPSVTLSLALQFPLAHYGNRRPAEQAFQCLR